MTGYDWSSTPEDVTDGLSNTIYLVQLPPGQPRPWIAGGGSTLLGVDTSVENPLADFVHQTPGGKAGTHVLMGDGSVRFLSADASPELFKGMVTRAGGETLADLDKFAPKEFPEGYTPELRGGPATMPITTRPPSPPVAPGGASVDADALAKLQGRWVPKVIIVDGVALTPEDFEKVKLKSIAFEGNSIMHG